jgi:hypothetical protein
MSKLDENKITRLNVFFCGVEPALVNEGFCASAVNRKTAHKYIILYIPEQSLGQAGLRIG